MHLRRQGQDLPRRSLPRVQGAAAADARRPRPADRAAARVHPRAGLAAARHRGRRGRRRHRHAGARGRRPGHRGRGIHRRQGPRAAGESARAAGKHHGNEVLDEAGVRAKFGSGRSRSSTTSRWPAPAWTTCRSSTRSGRRLRRSAAGVRLARAIVARSDEIGGKVGETCASTSGSCARQKARHLGCDLETAGRGRLSPAARQGQAPRALARWSSRPGSGKCKAILPLPPRGRGSG